MTEIIRPADSISRQISEAITHSVDRAIKKTKILYPWDIVFDKKGMWWDTSLVKKNEAIKKTIDDSSAERDTLLYFPEQKKPYVAYVEESHWYHYLLYMALVKADEKNQLDPDFSYYEEMTQKMLSHELLHATPLLGYSEAKIHYGVSFLKRAWVRNDLTLQPIIDVVGYVPVSVFLDMVTNPEILSFGDTAILTNLSV